MLWLLFAVLGGLSKSLLDLLTKRLMKNLDEYLVTWAKNFFSLPFLFVLLLFFKIPEIKPGFWLIVLIAMPLEMIAMFMYMRAIKTSPLSLIIPLLGLTPIIMIFTSFLMINELPNTIGFIGILVIVIGIYILGKGSNKTGFFAPLKSIIKDKGAILMIAVAIIFAIVPIYAKMGSVRSSYVFYTTILMMLISVVYTIIIRFKSKDIIKNIKENYLMFFLLGFLFTCELVFIIAAFEYTLVNYAMSVKRSSIIFSVFFGFLFFKEKNIIYMIIASVIIFLGIILISLA